jgi:hypothetical protein
VSDLAQFEAKFRRLAELREQRDTDKAALKNSENAYREYEAELLETVADSSLRGSVEFDFGGDLGVIRFQPRGTIYGKVIDKAAALDSLEAEMLKEEMTSEAIEARRLNEYVRDLLERGEELPEGIGFYERKFFTITHKANG